MNHNTVITLAVLALWLVYLAAFGVRNWRKALLSYDWLDLWHEIVLNILLLLFVVVVIVTLWV